GPQKAMARLRLDDRRSALKIVAPGNGENSRLLQRLLGENGEARMPLGGDPLKPEQIALIRKWIDEGAAWPEGDGATGRLTRGAKESEPPKHWAFVAPVRPRAPEVKNRDWIKNPVDQFILARLEKEGLRPSPEIDRVTLLRRLSLDLIG